ncbi:hypothetical protein BHM03_00051133 [Ensete ventricosum]|nr:hypothetical protein BHM03_00051133 [Ensete ventricosum]
MLVARPSLHFASGPLSLGCYVRCIFVVKDESAPVLPLPLSNDSKLSPLNRSIDLINSLTMTTTISLMSLISGNRGRSLVDSPHLPIPVAVPCLPHATTVGGRTATRYFRLFLLILQLHDHLLVIGDASASSPLTRALNIVQP